MAESVACYGYVVWLLSSLEMKVHQSVLVANNLKHCHKEQNTRKSVLDRIQRRQLKWCGHLLKMDNSHWPKFYHWTPHGGRKKRRTATIIEGPSDGHHEKQTYGIIQGKRQTSLASGNWQTGLTRYTLIIIKIINNSGRHSPFRVTALHPTRRTSSSSMRIC